MDLQFKIQQWLDKRNQIVSHRQLAVISGEQDWAIERAEALLQDFTAVSGDACLWVGYRDSPTEIHNSGSYRHHLGQERTAVVYNCFSGLRANALIAYSGIIRAHGLMILICPEFEEWPYYADPEAHKRTSFGFHRRDKPSLFIRWLIKNIKSEPATFIINQQKVGGELAPAAQSGLTRYLHDTTPEQQTAIEQIVHSAFGHRHRPLVITADRGRGKSSALGLAAKQLLTEHHKKIIVTAPTVHNVEQVFAHSGQSSMRQDSQHSEGSGSTGSLRFIPPDVLLREPCVADILFIDEAAAIPSSLLKQLLNQFPRVVMCTTIHGYEGGGRGFELRFKPYLDQANAGWKHIHLNMPIRWYQDDLLERFWFKVMLMRESRSEPRLAIKQAELRCRILDRNQLVLDPETLFTIFNLLVNAHYQTTPDDLVRLLDAPEQSLYIVQHGSSVLAVALLVDEGGPALAALSDQIISGERRVSGHLVAQNLAYHSADKRWCGLKQRRILRIAVDHQHRKSGLGSLLLQTVAEDAKHCGIDLLSSSFGATSALLYFWQTNDFSPCKLGFKRDAASDEHSAIVCRPLTPDAAEVLTTTHHQFAEELIYQSSRYYRSLDSGLLCTMFRGTDLDISLTSLEQAIFLQFLAEKRPYQSCARVITKYFVLALSKCQISTGIPVEEQLLMATLVQSKTESQVCRLFSLTGKKELQHRVLAAMRSLV